jgi:virulence-associated protein VagC
MDTARLFQSGHSQAVRLPMKYRFSGNEVVMKYFGNGVLLLPINDLPRYQYLHLHHQCQASSYT